MGPDVAGLDTRKKAMRSSLMGSNLTQVSGANCGANRGANGNSLRSPDRSEMGFLLLSRALRVLYMNPQAAEILSYPEKVRRTKAIAHQLPQRCTRCLGGRPSAEASVCEGFPSGRRRYVCRSFAVQLPGDDSRGPAFALLLDRSPELTVDVLKICAQYDLTPREREGVELLLHGLCDKEIASRMQISPNTLKVFLRFARMKMGVSSRCAIMEKFIHPKI